ncbi:MAG: hypothetical protein QOJ07_360, partial [Thermoleophilaceae bacterium]|nr:hypothetical protein [Thermoleophilaceae bacterium]
IDFRGRRLFVDAPEVGAIRHGVVVLDLTVGDLARAASDPAAQPRWPGGPRPVPARRTSEAATPDDAVGLMAALSRMFVAGRVSLRMLERDVERALGARTSADLDTIAGELLAAAIA